MDNFQLFWIRLKKELKGMAKGSEDGDEELLAISEVLDIMEHIEGR
jgi:hypothetical protein